MDTRRLLLHPVRLRIVNTVLDGRDFTAADLQRRLGDVSRATTYRQLALLVEGGLVQQVAEERVRGGTRRSYRLDPRRPLLDDDDVSRHTPVDHRELVAHLATTMVAGFSRYLDQPEARPAATSYRQFALWLDAAERDQLNRELEHLVARFAREGSGGERRQHLLTMVLFPNTA